MSSGRHNVGGINVKLVASLIMFGVAVVCLILAERVWERTGGAPDPRKEYLGTLLSTLIFLSGIVSFIVGMALAASFMNE